jgi:transposase
MSDGSWSSRRADVRQRREWWRAAASCCWAADGLQNKQIAETLKVAPRMAALWRGRFLEQGIEGLLQDAPRPGRTPSISADVTARLIAKTTQSTPAHATHWSTRTMAKAMGISKASVSRIWRANGLKPHRGESFKVSNDPEFADKLEALVGLYLHPPEHALVLCCEFLAGVQLLMGQRGTVFARTFEAWEYFGRTEFRLSVRQMEGRTRIS